MNKRIRTFLGAFVGVLLISISVYGYSPQMEMPILVIQAGDYNNGVRYFETATSGLGIPLEWIEDLREYEIGIGYTIEYSREVAYGTLESGKYRTAIFVFGNLYSGKGVIDGGPYINTVEEIKKAEAQIELCKRMGIKTIGVNYTDANYDKPWDEEYTRQVIEVIGSKMDFLLLKDQNSEIDKLFLDVAVKNNIEFEPLYQYKICSDKNFSEQYSEYKRELVTVLKEIFGIE